MWHALTALTVLIPMMAGLLIVGLMAGGTRPLTATGADDDDPGAQERRRQYREMLELRRPFDDDPAPAKKRKRKKS